MSRVSASPLSAYTANKENAMYGSSSSSTGAAAPSAKAVGDAPSPSLPMVELSSDVKALVLENEEMLHIITNLHLENSVLRAKLSDHENLKSEVVVLRKELGYVTADTTDKTYKAQNYKKTAEDLQKVVARLEMENETNKKLLAEATERERTAQGRSGGAAAEARAYQQQQEMDRKEVCSGLRLHNEACKKLEAAFAKFREDNHLVQPTVKSEVSAVEQLIQRYCSNPIAEKQKAMEAGQATDVALPALEWSEKLLRLLLEVLKAYAEEKIAKGKKGKA